MDNCVISNIVTRRVSERIKKEREGFLIIVEEYSATDTDSESEEKPDVHIKKEDEDFTMSDMRIKNRENNYSKDLVQVCPQDTDKIDSKPPTCYLCDSTFKSLDELLFHGTAHTTLIGSSYQCNECKSVLKLKSFARTHMLKHNWVRFKCKLCPRTFCSSTYQHLHMKHEHRGVTYHCPHCDKTYTQNVNLKQHILSHKGIYFTCFHCDRKFTHRALLVRHMEKHMNIKHYQCKICYRNIKHLRYYRRHMLFHKGLSNFECHICAKQFSVKNSLRVHMERHEDAVFHKCSHCKKNYSTEKALKKHMLRHTQAALDLTCEICGKVYATKKYFEEHMSQHRGHSYHCNQCDKTFTHINNLKRHVLQHDSDRQTYTCAICNKTFTWKESIVSHMSTHDEHRKTVSCKLCDVELLSRACYQSHKKSLNHRQRLKEARKENWTHNKVCEIKSLGDDNLLEINIVK